MTSADVHVRADGSARVVVIDRPERRNALAPDTLVALRKVAVALGKDAHARGIVLTGGVAAGVFLSGGDLHALASVKTAAAARTMARTAHAALDALRATGLPVIAAVHGDAYGGGCELAAACDLRVCESGVRFHWVQARMGVTTGWGGTARLLELVSQGTAMRWLLTTQAVSTDEGHATGFVDVVVAPGEAVRSAVAMVEEMARHPRATIAASLALVRASGRLSPAAARRLELSTFGRAWASEEHHTAVAAFMARRR